MIDTTLHITNGSALTDYLLKLDISKKENIITWEETLCVGPTVEEVASPAFIKIRQAFFKSFYDLTLSKKDLISGLQKLDDISNFTEIVLWFEYDLFCHINMVAVISLLEQSDLSSRSISEKLPHSKDNVTLALKLLLENNIISFKTKTTSVIPTDMCYAELIALYQAAKRLKATSNLFASLMPLLLAKP